MSIHSQSNHLEAEGYRLIKACLQHDGRIECVRTFEGARADCCVHLHGCDEKSVGVQIKTTAAPFAVTSGNTMQYRFSDTLGYQGLLVLCVAIDTKRVWAYLGDTIQHNAIRIPTGIDTYSRHAQHETSLNELPHVIHWMLTCPSSALTVQCVEKFMAPAHPKGRAEYDAFQHLKSRLPLVYIAPDVEGRHHDWTVDGKKWQMKLAVYIPKTDRYQAVLQKQMKRQGRGKPRLKKQYGQNDFEWLCLQLPQDQELAYLIPMQVLVQRGLAGRDISTATIHMYPHRRAQERTRWIEAYKIDLSTTEAAMKDYQRVVSSQQSLHESHNAPGASIISD